MGIRFCTLEGKKKAFPITVFYLLFFFLSVFFKFALLSFTVFLRLLFRNKYYMFWCEQIPYQYNDKFLGAHTVVFDKSMAAIGVAARMQISDQMAMGRNGDNIK